MTDPYARRKLVGAILVIILLLILLIGEAMQDRTLRRWAYAWLGVVLGGLGVIGVCLWLLLSPVLAHDHEHPELNEWYKSLHAESGAWCCEGDDATHLADIDWETKDGHYRVRVEDKWYEVPDSAVVNKPNKDGRAMVWMTSGYLKEPRCFMPGSLG